MRTSRDVLRPLVALVLVLGSVPLVSAVAAYRTASTHRVSCPQADAAGRGADLPPQCQSAADPKASRERRERSETDRRESDEDGDGGGSRQSGSHVEVTTTTGGS